MTGQDNLKHKMIIGGIIAVVIPFVITGAIIYIQLSGSLMQMAKKRSLHLSNDIAQIIDNFIEFNLRFIISIASDPDVIDALKTSDYEIVTHELNAIYKNIQWDETTIFLTDKDGIAKVDTRFPHQQGLDLSDRDYFIKAKNGVANVSNPIFARSDRDHDRKTIIVVCAPIFENDVFWGICGMIFTTEYIADIISKTTMDEAGYAYLLNKDGLVLVHPDPDIVLKRNLFKWPSTLVLKNIVNSRRPGVAFYTFGGVEKIAGINQVKHTGWTVAYTQTKDEIMAPVNRLLLLVFISGIVFVVVTIVIIIIVSDRISSPIQQMMNTVSQVAQYSTEVIVQIGLNRRIFFANPAFEKITGIKVEDTIGTVPSLENNSGIPPQNIWNELEAGNAWSGQLEFKAQSSKIIITLDVMILPIRDGKGHIQGYLTFGRDVTEELMFEKRVNQAQKLESIGTLAGGIAHDFNNILSIIFGYAELSLLSHDLDPANEGNIRQIIVASERARGLVTQILNFSRQSDVELVPVNLGTIVKEALKLLRASTPSFITIDSDIAGTSNVLAEPTQIHQVVMNLFTNAAHAIGENPGRITLTLQDFMVDREFTKTHPGIHEGKHLILSITDTGCGITPETIEYIFNPFFTTKPKKKGTGLGLSVVHGIVKKMNGIITVYSHPGRGATFNVVLPAIADEASEVGDISPSIKYGTERIVLIDDEIHIVSAMQSILISLGYHVTAFTDSAQALSAIQSSPGEFDLIITDYTMPGLTGLDMFKKLRSGDIFIPVILMSGFLGRSIESSAKEAGIAQLLHKPVNTYQLSNSIRKALGD
jgi:PAS domain S-box-containing protein